MGSNSFPIGHLQGSEQPDVRKQEAIDPVFCYFNIAGKEKTQAV